MKNKTKVMKTDWDYNSYTNIFRNADSSSVAFRNALSLCFRELYRGNLRFKDVITCGFINNQDYMFLMDLQMEKYDDFKVLQGKLEALSIVLGIEL
jgi:hypothetical protein